MTVQYKTPGVYVEEIDAFPPSIVGVDTAVPVFIGYTAKAEKNGRNLMLQPVRIGSMVEYAAIFGGAFEPQFTVIDADAVVNAAQTDVKTAGDKLAALKPNDPTLQAAKDEKKAADDKLKAAQIAAVDFTIAGTHYALGVGDIVYLLYNSMRLFYANGGGNCYVVSVGDYKSPVTLEDLTNGLTAVRDLVGPTMLVIPEAVLLGDHKIQLPADDDKKLTAAMANYSTLVAAMLEQCKTKQDRVAILDMWGIDKLRPDDLPGGFAQAKTAFRDAVSSVSSEALKYGMVYAPFVKTSVIDPSEFDYTNFAEFGPDQGTGHWQPGALTTALLQAANQLYPDTESPKAIAPPITTTPTPTPTPTPVTLRLLSYPTAAPEWWKEGKQFPSGLTLTAKTREIGALYIGKIKDAKEMEKGPDQDAAIKKINQGLTAQVPVLQDIYAAMAAKLSILPPSAAMAGVYTRNDADRGVWNAPANVGLVSVIGPTLQISNTMQDDLNMPIDGLAINAIRDFVGRGTLVWGARTLDGNSNDWRYIQVRRALIYIEQSVELALNKFVFEPNVAQTWVTVTSMIGSFLRGVWQAGGLMGASPAEAFTVQCGLGSTMTAQDILLGTMNVQITLQMVHPAEFIVLTFKQQMQGGA